MMVHAHHRANSVHGRNTRTRPMRSVRASRRSIASSKSGEPSRHKEGRPKGSTKAHSLEKLLAKTVAVTAPGGRRVRKTLGEVIHIKLVEKAALGDLDAMRLIKHTEIQIRRYNLAGAPTVEEVKRQIAQEEE